MKRKIFFSVSILFLIAVLIFYFSEKKEIKNLGANLVKSCQGIPDLSDKNTKIVTKVLDGDTFLIEGGYAVRILGIDADEKGYPCYEEAKKKLEELILNKEVVLEKGTKNFDQYCRYLRYVLIDDKNVALELVKEGLAVARFSPEDSKYREEISEVEKEARENKIGCKWQISNKEEEREENKFSLHWKKLKTETTGLKVISSCQAGNYYGKEVIVEGKVVDGYRSKTNTVFLNFEKPYPNQCFTAVIFNSDQDKFVKNPEIFYEGKIIRVRGLVKEYQGKPEIILKDPSQIEIGI